MTGGIEIKKNSRLEAAHLSLGKNNEKTKNATGAILVEVKLILTQNNLHEGS